MTATTPWTAKLKRVFAMDSPWPWLSYLLIFFAPWAVRPPQTDEIWLAVIAIPLFLLLYFRGFRAEGAMPFVYAAGIAGLGFAGGLILQTANVFLVYAGAMIGSTRPVRHAVVGVGVLVAAIIAYGLVLSAPFPFWTAGAFFTAMIGLSNMMAGELQHKNEMLQAANAETQRLATQAERERLARDLHDVLGHTLTIIAVKAELAARLIGSNPHRAKAEVADIQATARRALQDVRLAVNDMKQATLAAEIARARTALAAVDVSLEGPAHLPPVPESLEQPIAFLIREAVTNVVRHANANVCAIHLDADDHAVRLTVRDDGRGGAVQSGNGMTGMRERVLALNGAFSLRDELGTVIEASLPLPTASAP